MGVNSIPAQKKELRPYIITTFVVIGLMLLTLWVSNWIDNPPEIAPEYNLSQDEILSIIEKHEQRWRIWNLHKYTFRLENYGGPWRYLNVEISVKQGELAEFICFTYEGVNKTCPTDPKYASMLEELSIPDPLFNQVRSYTDSPNRAHCLTVNFHPIFGFPEEIVFDCPDVKDEEGWFYMNDFVLQ